MHRGWTNQGHIGAHSSLFCPSASQSGPANSMLTLTMVDILLLHALTYLLYKAIKD